MLLPSPPGAEITGVHHHHGAAPVHEVLGIESKGLKHAISALLLNTTTTQNFPAHILKYHLKEDFYS